ncbi:hypothetical protein [Candidatus Nitrospira bockiana]
MNDRPDIDDRGLDVLAQMLIELLEVPLTRLSQPEVQAWLRAALLCVDGLPSETRDRWLTVVTRRVIATWPDLGMHEANLKRDLGSMMADAGQEWRRWKAVYAPESAKVQS